MKKLPFVKYVSLLGVLGFIGCTNQVPRQGDFDDMYGTSASVVIINKNYYTTPPQNTVIQEPDYSADFDRSADFSEEPISDVYFPEDYVSSTQFRRSVTADPGYSSGYSQGYREGWNDYAWAQPMGWNSPFNRFSYNPWFGAGFNSFDPFSPFGFHGFSPFGFNNFNRFSSFGLYAGFSTGFGGFYDPFFGSGFGNPWMMSPWDYGFGFSPFGFNSFGYRNGFGWGGVNRPIIITNNYIGSDKSRIASRTYGARTGGRATDNYNDRYQANTRSSARVSANTPPSRTNTVQSNRVASTGYIAERATRGNGSYVNPNPTSNRAAVASTNDKSVSRSSYARSATSSSTGDSFNRTCSTSTYSQPARSASARSFDYARPARSTYSTPSSTNSSSGYSPSRSYSPSSSSSSSRSYSAPASRSYSPASSSSSMGSSRGSSGGSSSGGGSRGPR